MEENYDARSVAYSTAMRNMFKQIPTTMTKLLSQRQKFKKLMTDIGDGWWMGKITKGLPPLRIQKLRKEHFKTMRYFSQPIFNSF